MITLTDENQTEKFYYLALSQRNFGYKSSKSFPAVKFFVQFWGHFI